MVGYNPANFFKKSSTVNSDVIVSYDPSIVTSKKKADNKAIKNAIEDSKAVVQSMTGNFAGQSNKLSNMSNKNSNSKSDRMFVLQNALLSKRVTTVKEAESLTGVSVKTVQVYIKELGYVIDSNGNIVK